MTAEPLPVEPVLPDLVDAVTRTGCAVLVAEPGAGKTTTVPVALLEPAGPGRLLLVQPRRVAADAVAARLAQALGGPLGARIGLRRRGRTVSGPGVAIEVVTDGVMLAMLRTDPTLEGIGTVVLDEVHERSLRLDVSLAVIAHVRRELRPDLRIVAMSATLDATAVASVIDPLPDRVPVFEVPGRTHAVELRHRSPDGAGMVGAVVAGVQEALDTTDGDILVFLPGAAEIGVVERALRRTPDVQPERGVDILVLHGRAHPADQDAALAPSRAGRRHVVLSTSIAQTSLTIPGVRAVVDSGLRRTTVRDARTGLPRMVTVAAARDTAAQRAGRAGRVSAGVAIRCWSAGDHARRRAHEPAEIDDGDLAPVVLELAAIGIAEPAELRWWTPPPAAAWGAAVDLLTQLGARAPDGRLTAVGAAMLDSGWHPRLAAAVTAHPDPPWRSTATAVVSFLEDGSLPTDPVDLRTAIPAALLRSGDERHDARRDRLRAALRGAGLGEPHVDPERIGHVVAHAFPERVAVRDPERHGIFRLWSGELLDGSGTEPAIAGASALAVADLDADRRGGRIHSAAPLSFRDVEALLPGRIATSDESVSSGDGEELGVEIVSTRSFGAALVDRVRRPPSASEGADAALRAVASDGLRRLGLLPVHANQAVARVLAARSIDASWPNADEVELAATASTWLAPRLPGPDPRRPLRGVDIGAALEAYLIGPRRRELDALAPTAVSLARGRVATLDWARGRERGEARPVLRARVQHLFGTTASPRVLGGRCPIVIELLSPADRPVAVTDDLERFWSSGYREVRAAMRGRYPRHAWPDDPRVVPASP